jgi:hypothetical protein
MRIIAGETFNVMSPRHCGELGSRLKSSWAVDIHDFVAPFIVLL